MWSERILFYSARNRLARMKGEESTQVQRSQDATGVKCRKRKLSM